jgi:hypothetical protein
MCRLGSFQCSTPIGDRVSAASPRCSPDTHCLGLLPRRVFGEQRGGAAEILSRIGVEHGNGPIYTSSGGIRTYLYLLDSLMHADSLLW